MSTPLDPRIRYVNPFPIPAWCYVAPTPAAISATLHVLGEALNQRLSPEKEAAITIILDEMQKNMPQMPKGIPQPTVHAEITRNLYTRKQEHTYHIRLGFIGCEKMPENIPPELQNYIVMPLSNTWWDLSGARNFIAKKFKSSFSHTEGQVTCQRVSITADETNDAAQSIGSSRDWGSGNAQAYTLELKLPAETGRSLYYLDKLKMHGFCRSIIPALREEVESKQSLAQLRATHGHMLSDKTAGK